KIIRLLDVKYQRTSAFSSTAYKYPLVGTTNVIPSSILSGWDSISVVFIKSSGNASVVIVTSDSVVSPSSFVASIFTLLSLSGYYPNTGIECDVSASSHVRTIGTSSKPVVTLISMGSSVSNINNALSGATS